MCCLRFWREDTTQNALEVDLWQLEGTKWVYDAKELIETEGGALKVELGEAL